MGQGPRRSRSASARYPAGAPRGGQGQRQAGGKQHGAAGERGPAARERQASGPAKGRFTRERAGKAPDQPGTERRRIGNREPRDEGRQHGGQKAGHERHPSVGKQGGDQNEDAAQVLRAAVGAAGHDERRPHTPERQDDGEMDPRREGPRRRPAEEAAGHAGHRLEAREREERSRPDTHGSARTPGLPWTALLIRRPATARDSARSGLRSRPGRGARPAERTRSRRRRRSGARLRPRGQQQAVP